MSNCRALTSSLQFGSLSLIRFTPRFTRAMVSCSFMSGRSVVSSESYARASSVDAPDLGDLRSQRNGHLPRTSLPVLRDDQLHKPVVGRVRIQQDHDVRVLLQGTGLPQVGHLRLLVDPPLRPTVELGRYDHRHLKIAGNPLETTGVLRHLLLAG